VRLHRAHLLLLTAALGFGAIAASGCSEETQDRAGDAVESAREDVEEGVQEASARAAAEAFRGSVRAKETDNATGGVRALDALEAAAQDLEDFPGDPTFAGIEDTDGDGVDDDGLVEVQVEEQVACVTLPESGNEIDVSGDPC